CHVCAGDPQHLPLAADEPVGGFDDGLSCFSGDQVRGAWRENCTEPAISGNGRLLRAQRREIRRAHLTPGPSSAERLFPNPPGHLGRRHAAQPAGVPVEPRCAETGHPRSGCPLCRLSPAAIVALVVASSESTPIGIGPPVRTALTNCSTSARWPLSCPPRA